MKMDFLLNLPPRARAKGFTFTELLVVVALAAVLGAILLPSLNTASDTAKAAVCLGNMHEWGMAISMYCDEFNDYFPYEGNSFNPLDDVFNLGAWYNVVPRYINQQRLVDLYNAGTQPRAGTKSVWICPSAINTTVSPTISNPYFTYAFNARMDPNGPAQFSRSQMTSPANTIIFGERGEDNISTVTGASAAARHFGGGNFVMGDSHAEWIKYDDFCRLCPANPFSDSDSAALGDWKTGVKYHWFPFRNAPT